MLKLHGSIEHRGSPSIASARAGSSNTWKILKGYLRCRAVNCLYTLAPAAEIEQNAIARERLLTSTSGINSQSKASSNKHRSFNASLPSP